MNGLELSQRDASSSQAKIGTQYQIAQYKTKRNLKT
jgi:hypothetical protein